MGEKDVNQRSLTNKNVVFADIVNVLIYDGEQVVLPEALENAVLAAPYLDSSGALRELQRDAVKLWREQDGVIFSFDRYER